MIKKVLNALKTDLRFSVTLLIVAGVLVDCQISSAQDASDAPQSANPHTVGWLNTFIPGSGRILMGQTALGFGQAGYELGTFFAGWGIAHHPKLTSLDGYDDPYNEVTTGLGANNLRTSHAQLDQTSDSTGQIFLQFAVKSHLLNTYLAYRDANRARGITAGLDQEDWFDGFSAPFSRERLLQPDVWIPLVMVGAFVALDYFTVVGSQAQQQPVNSFSNFMSGFYQVVWEPIGSGWPEEAFYRGFLQRELTETSGSQLLGVAGETAAFAFSHEAGPGRITAAVAGTYLGYLAARHEGDLRPGITLHFWSNILLGLETILLRQQAQKTTPPAGFSVQINY